MEFTVENYQELYEIYIEDSVQLYEICCRYRIVVIESKFKGGVISYKLENMKGIMHILLYNYKKDNDFNLNSYAINIQVLDISKSPIHTPFNVFSDASYIPFDELEDYLEWYSKIDDIDILEFTTPN
jgi:hypothetical protein